MKYDQINQQFGKEEIYHICFSTYKNSWLFVGIYKEFVRLLILDIAKTKKIKIFIFKIMPTHIHILLYKEKNQLIPQITQFLKGKIAFDFFKKFPDVKIDLHSNHLWKAGYWAVLIKNRNQFNTTFLYIKNNDFELKKLEQ